MDLNEALAIHKYLEYARRSSMEEDMYREAWKTIVQEAVKALEKRKPL